MHQFFCFFKADTAGHSNTSCGFNLPQCLTWCQIDFLMLRSRLCEAKPSDPQVLVLLLWRWFNEWLSFIVMLYNEFLITAVTVLYLCVYCSKPINSIQQISAVTTKCNAQITMVVNIWERKRNESSKSETAYWLPLLWVYMGINAVAIIDLDWDQNQ